MRAGLSADHEVPRRVKTEVSVNGPDDVYVEGRGRIERAHDAAGRIIVGKVRGGEAPPCAAQKLRNVVLLRSPDEGIPNRWVVPSPGVARVLDLLGRRSYIRQ